MRALQVLSHDAAPEIRDIPVPDPAEGQIRVDIAACGINFADLLIAGGTYQDLPPLPATLGMEVSGTVSALGPGTVGVAVGDRVAVFSGHGGLAEQGVFDVAHVMPLPDAMPFDVAAGFMVAYGTAHLALTHRAQLTEGETLLVLGAAGGVGLAAVEIGRLLGARVIAVARGNAKREVARQAGAHHLIDSEASDLRAQVRALGGVNVIFDPVGGDLMREALRCVQPEARALSIGFASGDVPSLPLNHLLVKNTAVIGVYWGGYKRFAPERLTGSLRALVDWYIAGRLRPHIGHHVPFEHAAEALELLRSRRSTGKVVVTMG